MWTKIYVWKVFLCHFSVKVLSRLFVSINKCWSYGSTTTTKLHMIQCHFFHFLKPLYFFNLIHFKFSEVFNCRDLFFLRRIERLKLGASIQISFICSFEQIFSLTAKITGRILSIYINTFCRRVFWRTWILDFF